MLLLQPWQVELKSVVKVKHIKKQTDQTNLNIGSGNVHGIYFSR